MRWHFRLSLLLLFVIVSHVASYAFASTIKIRSHGPVAMLTGVPRVYDGDSIFFGNMEVRLNAIDAPEHDQACKNKKGQFWPCGIAARDALRRLIGNREVRCAISGRDKYRRLLGICYVRAQGRGGVLHDDLAGEVLRSKTGGSVSPEIDLNAEMVKEGNAIAYHYFSEKYARQEAQAKAAARGIWQDAAFTDPYYCRHFQDGHPCYEYDFISQTSEVAERPLIGKSRAIGAPD